jgi:hypothetical protein
VPARDRPRYHSDLAGTATKPNKMSSVSTASLAIASGLVLISRKLVASLPVPRLHFKSTSWHRKIQSFRSLRIRVALTK